MGRKEKAEGSRAEEVYEVVDYGESINFEQYEGNLEEHENIPQAGSAACRYIKADIERKRELGVSGPFLGLEIGCASGRLTRKLGLIPGVNFTGVDISSSFIEAAKRRNNLPNVEYVLSDFLAYESKEKFDYIVLFGVWHHVPLHLRDAWLEKMRCQLKTGGKLILWDEVLPRNSYKTEEGRRARAGLLYSKYIGGPLKIKNFNLAYDECLNFLSDTLDENVRGYYDDQLLSYIAEQAKDIYERLYTFDGNKKYTLKAALGRINKLIREVGKRSIELSGSPSAKRVVRGDFKESSNEIEKRFGDFKLEDTLEGFELVDSMSSGEIEYVGGMGGFIFQAT